MTERIALRDAPRQLQETPWGRADQIEKLGEGAYFVSTPGHGGVWLCPERMAELPEEVRGLNVYGRGSWFEEDCEWSLVWYVWPDLFPEEWADGARATLKSYYPSVTVEGKG